MKIIFATSVPFPEGLSSTRRIRIILAGLAAQGHEVTLLLPYAREVREPEVVFEGYRVVWCEVPASESDGLSINQRGSFLVQIRSRLKWLYRVLDFSLTRGAYDWLYIYQPGPDALVAAVIARLTGHCVVSEFVDILTSNWFLTWKMQLYYRMWSIACYLTPKLSQLILVISTMLETRYRALAPNASFLLLPTLVNVQAFQKGDSSRYRLKFDFNDNKIIAYTGSFSKMQGVSNLVYAMKVVSEHHPEARLLLAGDWVGSDISDDIPSLIKELQINNSVIYVGCLSQEEVIDLLASADILVLPKLDDPVNHAGLSAKLGEYLATGKPVVASRVGDVSRYLQHDKSAMLCTPGNIEDLAYGISRLLDDEDLAGRIGRAGQRVAIEYFDVEPNIHRLEEAMQKAYSITA